MSPVSSREEVSLRTETVIERNEKETGRVEAFSDGMFAIAMTLLILEIKVPYDAGRGLASALAAQWPSFLAFIAVIYNLLWRHASSPRRSPSLLRIPTDDPVVLTISRQYLFGPLIYGLAFALAFVDARASLVTNLLLALFFAFPPRKK